MFTNVDLWSAHLMVAARVLGLVVTWHLVLWFLRSGRLTMLVSAFGFLLSVVAGGHMPEGTDFGWAVGSIVIAITTLLTMLPVPTLENGRGFTAAAAVGGATALGGVIASVAPAVQSFASTLFPVAAVLLAIAYLFRVRTTPKVGMLLHAALLGSVAHAVRFLVPNPYGTLLGAAFWFVFLGAAAAYLLRLMADRTRDVALLASATDELAGIVELDAAAVVAVDKRGVIMRVNRAAEQMMGIRRENMVGRLYSKVFAHVPADQWHVIHTLEQGVEYNGTMDGFCYYRGRRTCNRIHTHRAYGSDGKILGAVVRYLDLTDEYEMQEALRRDAQLVAAGRIATGTAHSIRDPVAAVKGLLQLAARKPPAERELYVRLAMEEVSRLEDVVEEFLLLAHPLPFAMDSVDLRPLMDEAVFAVRTEMENRHIRLEYRSEEMRIKGDRNRLRRLLGKLLRHALTQVTAGDTICFRGRCTEGAIDIAVEWPGRSLSPGEEVHFFDANLEPGSSGFGLAACKRITEEHGGTIVVVNSTATIQVAASLPRAEGTRVVI